MSDLNIIINNLKTKQSEIVNEITNYEAEELNLTQKLSEIKSLRANKVKMKEKCDLALKKATEQLNIYNNVLEESQSFLQSYISPTISTSSRLSLNEAHNSNNHNNTSSATANEG